MKWDGAIICTERMRWERASTSTSYQAGVAGSNIEKRIAVRAQRRRRVEQVDVAHVRAPRERREIEALLG